MGRPFDDAACVADPEECGLSVECLGEGRGKTRPRLGVVGRFVNVRNEIGASALRCHIEARGLPLCSLRHAR
jgi:hypothetical protein